VPSSVKLLLEPKAPLVECRLVDYSAGGACIELPRSLQVPERFEMFHGNIKKRCRRVWSRGLRIGVSF
jgi:PilZ domain